MPDRASTDLRNWAGNIRFSPSSFEQPATLDEARAAVAAAPRVRVLGSGHSFNTIADTDAVMLSLTGIEPDVRISALDGTVTASGWLTYARLGAAVHRAGFALHNLASLPHISVAGSIATGTHGSGDANGNLATAVAAIEFIGPDGELRTVARGDEDFPGSVVHLGALGVVHTVTLDLLAGFEMRQYVYDGLTYEAVVDHFDELTSAAYSTSLFTAWGAEPAFQFWVKQRTADQSHPFPKANWYGAPLADGPRHPVPGVDPAACTVQQGQTGPWLERLAHFRPEFTPSAGDELQSEYLIDRADAPAAIEALAGIGRLLAPVTQISEIRTMAGDDLWLSPAYGRDTVGLHFTWVSDVEAVRPAMLAVETALAPFAARPHWGKLFSMPIGEVRSRYPRMGDFEKLRERVDPEGKFANHFSTAVVGGAAL
ncbi:D-arabinono-1,4-lactone oxidase [Glycomyces paridis]|uniref:FAD-binding protein n=1 Tax=Glycomyces paridis TaxID=2126555 RepID=A0A4S8PGG4_9ACTN|nr:D-arabinono-1,4-lactone oxidase [Glycomyces paridis]THV28705.1 FAD-binding protein [Glycomyces paridis]